MSEHNFIQFRSAYLDLINSAITDGKLQLDSTELIAARNIRIINLEGQFTTMIDSQVWGKIPDKLKADFHDLAVRFGYGKP